MQDSESKSWWQQVSGKAILGSQKGRRLKLVPCDELTFSTWKQANPQGRVLRPGSNWKATEEYMEAWETEVQGLPVVTSVTLLQPRELVIGITLASSAKAYPYKLILKQGPVILDKIDGTPVMIVLHEDRHSVRCYLPNAAGQNLEFVAKPDSHPFRMMDLQTGSEWDFWGNALAGPLAGTKLKPTPFLNDYWFDWKNYHPDTYLYTPKARS